GGPWVSRLHLKLAPAEVGVKLRRLIIDAHRLLEELVRGLELPLLEQLFAQLKLGFGEPQLSNPRSEIRLRVRPAHRALGAIDAAGGLRAAFLGSRGRPVALAGR